MYSVSVAQTEMAVDSVSQVQWGIVSVAGLTIIKDYELIQIVVFIIFAMLQRDEVKGWLMIPYTDAKIAKCVAYL